MIEISKFSYDEDDISDRNETCQEPMPDKLECKNEKVLCTEFNIQLRYHLHLQMTLPCVFIDSYAQKNENLDDPTQQMHFKEETDKLWEFAQNTTEFKFKTIDEVLQENYEMREEIDWLNDIIMYNISQLDKADEELKQADDELQDELATEMANRKSAESKINDDISGVDDRVDGIDDRVDGVDDRIDTLENTVLRSCAVDSDCGETLSCVDGWCTVAECTSNDQCPSTLPICKNPGHKCVECLENEDCQSSNVCDTATNRCYISYIEHDCSGEWLGIKYDDKEAAISGCNTRSECDCFNVDDTYHYFLHPGRETHYARAGYEAWVKQ